MGTISKATVLTVEKHGEEVREYTLQLHKNNHFEAGSFLQLTLEIKKDLSRWPDSRNFSIASAYNKEGIIRLIIRQFGSYTKRIFNELQPGSECTVKYAFGDFLLPFFDKQATICCVAGGTGIAPILGFCEQMSQTGSLNRLHVYYSFKHANEMPGVELLRKLLPAENLHLFCTQQEMDQIPNRRIVFEDIQFTDLSSTYFYICGNESFTHYFVGNLKKIKAENIYTDEW